MLVVIQLRKSQSKRPQLLRIIILVRQTKTRRNMYLVEIQMILMNIIHYHQPIIRPNQPQISTTTMMIIMVLLIMTTINKRKRSTPQSKNNNQRLNRLHPILYQSLMNSHQLLNLLLSSQSLLLRRMLIQQRQSLN